MNTGSIRCRKICPFNRMVEVSPGVYLGTCPFPPTVSCPKAEQDLENFCDNVSPPLDLLALLLFCGPLLELPFPIALIKFGLYAACVGGLTALQNLCTIVAATLVVSGEVTCSAVRTCSYFS